MPHSKIEKNSLGSEIRELRLMGMSYSRIAEEMKEKYGVEMSHMAISRYFNKIDNEHISTHTKPNSNDLAISKLYDSNISDVRRLKEELTNLSNTIKLEKNPQALKRLSEETISKFHNELLTITERTQVLISLMRAHERNMREFLIGVSNCLCSDCTGVLIDHLNKHE